MSIPVDQIVANGIYKTATNQLRKVIRIFNDEQNRVCVEYKSKSANYPERPFEIAHTKANPPLIKSFANACMSREK